MATPKPPGPRFETLVEGGATDAGLPRVGPSAPAFIFFTSGSTARPKGVTHTLETAGWIIASTAQAWEFTPEDSFLTASPLSHEGGMGMSFGALAGGARVAIARSVDAEGSELPAGANGRLWIRLPTNCIGYWSNPAATAEAIHDGWLDTGDVMRVDEDGYLWFAGRQKQIIVHDGSNFPPQGVEEALLAHPAVASAGVIGIHDLRHGETVRAYVALAAGALAPREAELIAFARERVGYKAPEHVVFLDEIPLTPVGKVDRTALKHRAEALP